MRKIFLELNQILYVTVALAVLAGCDRTVVEKDYSGELCPISFGSNISAETQVTRSATAVGLEELADSFIVTGYKNSPTDGLQDVMNSYKVCYVSNTDGSSVTNTAGWDYVGQGPDQVTKYWDYSTTDYRFMGYVPKRATGKIDYSGSMSLNKNNVVLTLSGVPRIAIAQNGVMTDPNSVSVSEQDLPFVSRLWHGTAPQNEPVRMEFIKTYSKLCIYLMRADNVDAQAVTNIRLNKSGGQIPLIGTVSFSYPLSAADTVVSVLSTIDTSTDGVTFNDVSAGVMASPNVPYPVYPQYLLLPDQNNDCKYSFTCAAYKCYIPAELMKFEPGYCYTFIFKITTPSVTKLAVDNYQMELSNVLRSTY